MLRYLFEVKTSQANTGYSTMTSCKCSRKTIDDLHNACLCILGSADGRDEKGTSHEFWRLFTRCMTKKEK